MVRYIKEYLAGDILGAWLGGLIALVIKGIAFSNGAPGYYDVPFWLIFGVSGLRFIRWGGILSVGLGLPGLILLLTLSLPIMVSIGGIVGGLISRALLPDHERRMRQVGGFIFGMLSTIWLPFSTA